MNTHYKVWILVAICLLSLLGCSSAGTGSRAERLPVAKVMLKPGDKIGDMVVTSGVKRAFPLWSYCLPIVENEHRIIVNCSEVSFDQLGIGHTFGVMDLVPSATDWEELTWQMTLDGYPIDLDAFGTYEFVHPDLVLNGSPIREVFLAVRVWDIVLVNPTPGKHVLEGQAQAEGRIYTWIVNFTVATRVLV